MELHFSFLFYVLFPLDGVFLTDIYPVHRLWSVLLWVLLPPASQPEQGTDTVLAAQEGKASLVALIHLPRP